MSFKLIPRFYYTLPFCKYLGCIWSNEVSLINETFGTDSKILHYNQARVGLYQLLNSISEKNLKVGVQAYTCYTVFQAIYNSGHRSVFIDLTDELKLDLLDLKHKIKDIDVLIITHTFGFPEHFNAIKEIVGNKIIIEDCSHSFLSKYYGKFTGTLGDAAIFSSGLAKFPPIGSGGFCIVNQIDKFPLLEEEYAITPAPSTMHSAKDFFKTILFSLLMKPPIYGFFTYRIGKLLASKLGTRNKFSFSESKGNSWTQKIFNYNFSFFQKLLHKQIDNSKLLSSLIKIKSPVFSNNDSISPNYYAYPILTKNRDEIYDKFLANNIQAGKHFQECLEWASKFGYKKGECPNTEKIVNQIITVPVHYGVNRKIIIKIANMI